MCWECEKAKKFTLSKENNKEEWDEITEIETTFLFFII